MSVNPFLTGKSGKLIYFYFKDKKTFFVTAFTLNVKMPGQLNS